MSTDDEIPITVDFRIAETARAWTEVADLKRPHRAQIRDELAARISGLRAILELGSGPGQLAERLLREPGIERYTLLDWSEAMHDLARTRVTHPAAEFVVVDFKAPDWARGFTDYDAIVTMQAVHELRHKRHAEALYREARKALRPGGILLVCDHLPFDPTKPGLYATVEEQRAAFEAAGYTAFLTELVIEGMYLCSGRA